MRKDHYDYPFTLVAFWYFSIGPFTPFLIMLCMRLDEIRDQSLPGEDLMELGFGLLLGVFATVVTTIFINSFPAVRINPRGMEIRFFFPILTRWISLPWSQVDGVRECVFLKYRVLRKDVKGLIISSQHLPPFYHLPALLWGHTTDRSVPINSRIKGYDDLVQSIKAACSVTTT